MADRGEPQGGVSPEEVVRGVCGSLPGVTEKLSHGAPTWFVGRRAFVTLWAGGHHDHDFPHLWCAAAPGAADALVEEAPDRYFRPPYVGARGWVGARLDRRPARDEIADLCEQAWSQVASARLKSQRR
ncbi:MAG TPA: MmcQ/YjbR family DNA-binding protein [Acidimicrobiales bacterium]|nr:MmcQ/YjbR family DNA-binding protein [Acidimicrobiales bacterium]